MINTLNTLITLDYGIKYKEEKIKTNTGEAMEFTKEEKEILEKIRSVRIYV